MTRYYLKTAGQFELDPFDEPQPMPSWTEISEPEYWIMLNVSDDVVLRVDGEIPDWMKEV